MSKREIKDTYIIECRCINEDNDFCMRLGFKCYYNKQAKTFSYKTRKFSPVCWKGSTMTPSEPDNINPYHLDFFNYAIPVTPSIDNAKIYKRLADVEKIISSIEKIGDFKCRVLVLRTTVIPLDEIGKNGYERF